MTLHERRVLLFLTLANLAGIVVAVLAPLHIYRNRIEHVKSGGLRFGEYGTIFSEGPFMVPFTGLDSRPMTIEFWMQCGLIDDSNTFLAFYDTARGISVSFHQREDDFAIQRWASGDAVNPASRKQLLVPTVFRADHPAFVTIASGGQATDVYVGGILIASKKTLGFTRADLAGRRAVFDAPRSTSSWGGVFRGFAMYETRLDAAAVQRHYESWTQTGKPSIQPADRPVALFLFNESSGNLLKNAYAGAADLMIPDRYTVIDQIVLGIPPKIYWKDTAANIAGFVSFGFLLNVLLTASQVRRPITWTIGLGFALSLTVEFVQSMLPTRDSSLADVINNTIGTALGVWIFHLTWIRAMFAHLLVRYI